MIRTFIYKDAYQEPYDGAPYEEPGGLDWVCGNLKPRFLWNT